MKAWKTRIANRFDGVGEVFIRSADGLADGRRSILTGNIFNNLALNLTSNLFFTGLLLYLLRGESTASQNGAIGLMGVITFACGMVQIFAPVVWERFRSRKKTLLIVRCVYHFFNIICVGMIPILPFPAHTRLVFFAAAVALLNLLVNFSNPGFAIWHMSLIPIRLRSMYFATTNMVFPVLNTLATVSAGLLLDSMKGAGYEYGGFLLIRAAALCAALLELWFFSKIPELPYESTGEKPRFRAIFTLPWKSVPYMLCTLVALLWTFSVTIVGQYFNAYLLDDVGMSYTFLSSIGIINIPLILFLTPLWSRLVNRFSWLPTLGVSILLYSVAYVVNAFTTAQASFLYYLSVIVGNMNAPGINIVFGNLPYLHMPKKSQTNYIAFYATVTNLAGLAGSFFGRFIVEATGNFRITIFGVSMQNKQYINLITFLLLLVTVSVIFAVDRYIKRLPKEEETPAS